MNFRGQLSPLRSDWILDSYQGATFHLTQVLTGHRYFLSILFKIRWEETPINHHGVGRPEGMVKHTVEICLACVQAPRGGDRRQRFLSSSPALGQSMEQECWMCDGSSWTLAPYFPCIREGEAISLMNERPHAPSLGVNSGFLAAPRKVYSTKCWGSLGPMPTRASGPPSANDDIWWLPIKKLLNHVRFIFAWLTIHICIFVLFNNYVTEIIHWTGK